MKKKVMFVSLFLVSAFALFSNFLFVKLSKEKSPNIYGVATEKISIIAPSDYEIISSNNSNYPEGYSYTTALSYNQVKEFYSSYNKLANKQTTGAVYDCEDKKSLYFVDIKNTKSDKTIVDFAYCK